MEKGPQIGAIPMSTRQIKMIKESRLKKIRGAKEALKEAKESLKVVEEALRLAENALGETVPKTSPRPAVRKSTRKTAK